MLSFYVCLLVCFLLCCCCCRRRRRRFGGNSTESLMDPPLHCPWRHRGTFRKPVCARPTTIEFAARNVTLAILVLLSTGLLSLPFVDIQDETKDLDDGVYVIFVGNCPDR